MTISMSKSIYPIVMLLICNNIFSRDKAENLFPPKKLVAHLKFDQWEWKEITSLAQKRLKDRIKNKEDFNCEVRGPMYYAPLEANSPCGYFVDGKEAFRKCSIRVKGNRNMNRKYTLYMPWIEVNGEKKLTYEIAVKGKGKIGFMLWVGGYKKNNSFFKWLAFPMLFVINATKGWTVYSGNFFLSKIKIPEDYSITKVFKGRLVVFPESDLFIDELKIWEIEKESK